MALIQKLCKFVYSGLRHAYRPKHYLEMAQDMNDRARLVKGYILTLTFNYRILLQIYLLKVSSVCSNINIFINNIFFYRPHIDQNHIDQNIGIILINQQSKTKELKVWGNRVYPAHTTIS